MTRQQCRAALDFPRAEGHWPAPKRRRVPVGPGGAARFGAADLSGPSPKSISVKERAMKALTKTTQSANAATVEKKWVLIDADGLEIGRASCRERVGQYVWLRVVPVSLKKKINIQKKK